MSAKSNTLQKPLYVYNLLINCLTNYIFETITHKNDTNTVIVGIYSLYARAILYIKSQKFVGKIVQMIGRGVK